jgi:hypothetical protein
MQPELPGPGDGATQFVIGAAVGSGIGAGVGSGTGALEGTELIASTGNSDGREIPDVSITFCLNGYDDEAETRLKGTFSSFLTY